MRARESQLASELFGAEDLAKILPVVRPRRQRLGDVRQRPRAARAGKSRSLPHAVMMMVPEAYDHDLPEDLKAFYAFQLSDGAVGRAAGGRVHRRPRDRRDAGPQRPSPRRWLETTDGWVVLGSETGVMDVPADPGRARAACMRKLFLVDLARRDRRRRRRQARSRAPSPTAKWFEQGSSTSPTCRRRRRTRSPRSRSTSASARSASRRRTCGSCSRRPRPRPRSRSARWATTPRWPCCRTASRRCSATSSSSSRRSRTR